MIQEVEVVTILIHVYSSKTTILFDACVIFCVAVVASSTTGDSFSGVLLGIPGANSAAATMVDGFPMAKNGEATRALSAVITSSTANGLFFGS